MTKFGTTSGQADLGSDVPPGRGIWWPRVVLLEVRLSFGQMYPPAETSHDQVWNYRWVPLKPDFLGA